MVNFDRSSVKHGTQNIQNENHQWLSDSFRVHRIRFRPRLCPGPHWGSLKRSPGPLAGLRDPTSKGEERGERGEGERNRGEEGTGGTGPLSQIPGSAPVVGFVVVKFCVFFTHIYCFEKNNFEFCGTFRKRRFQCLMQPMGIARFMYMNI